MKKPWSTAKTPGEQSPFWWLRWVPALVIAVLIIYFLYVFGSVALVPVLASFAMAYLLDPVVWQFQKRGLSRMWSSIIAILLVTLVIAGFLTYVIPELWSESRKAGVQIAAQFTPENAARQREVLRRYSPALERMAGDKIEQFLSNPLTFYGENVATGSTSVDANGNVVASTGAGSMLSSALSSSLDLMLVPFFVFYTLIDFSKWRVSLEELIPPRFREPFKQLFDESGRILQAYVRGQLLIGAIMAVCYAIGFFFLGVPAWAGIAMIAGLLNAIPYVGTVLGIVLAGGFTAAGGGGFWDIMAVLGVFVAVQSLEGYVLTPRILGGRLNLHPMAVFLGLLIGGKLFGLLGIVLAIPAIAISKVFLKFLTELYQGSYFYHAGDLDPLELPSNNIEERIAEAAGNVLATQQQNDEVEDAPKNASKNIITEMPTILEKPI